MANFAVPAGKKTGVSDSTLKDKSGKSHGAKKHVFQDNAGNSHVTALVAAEKDATPTALDWKEEFARDSKPNRRHVINLVFNDANGRPVTAFDPPVELRVMLTPAEQANAGAQLVYYDPNQRKWIAFAGASKMGSEFVASISAWFSDPAVGVDTP